MIVLKYTVGVANLQMPGVSREMGNRGRKGMGIRLIECKAHTWIIAKHAAWNLLVLGTCLISYSLYPKREEGNSKLLFFVFLAAF